MDCHSPQLVVIQNSSVFLKGKLCLIPAIGHRDLIDLRIHVISCGRCKLPHIKGLCNLRKSQVSKSDTTAAVGILHINSVCFCASLCLVFVIIQSDLRSRQNVVRPGNLLVHHNRKQLCIRDITACRRNRISGYHVGACHSMFHINGIAVRGSDFLQIVSSRRK